MFDQMTRAIALLQQRSRHRREYNDLMRFSDSQLRDIGLTRDEVKRAARGVAGGLRTFRSM